VKVKNPRKCWYNVGRDLFDKVMVEGKKTGNCSGVHIEKCYKIICEF